MWERGLKQLYHTGGTPFPGRSPCGCLLLIVDEDPRPLVTVTGKADEQVIRYEDLQEMEE